MAIVIKHSDQLVLSAQQFDFCITGRVLLAMATFASKQEGEWVCWPSKATLARLTGVSARTIQTSLQRLADLKLISTRSRLARSNVYTFNAAVIVRPAHETLLALGNACAMTDELTAKVSAARARFEEVKARFQGRSIASPLPEQALISPTSTGGDQGDLPNKGLKDQSSREDQQRERQAPAPLSQKTALQKKGQSPSLTSTSKPTAYTGNRSPRMIQMAMQCAQHKIRELTERLTSLLNEKAPQGAIEGVRVELTHWHEKMAEHSDMAA